jgi:hypothetical protein
VAFLSKSGARRLLLIIVLSQVMTAMGSVNVYAGFGSQVLSFTPSPSGNGRAVAFDPATGNIYYTLSGSTDIFITDRNNSPAKTISPGIVFGALSWDAKRGVLWGGAYSPGKLGNIYQISPNGVATFKFVFAPPGGNCYGGTPGFVDGLAYDSSDDSLWISDDAGIQIHHVDVAGRLIASFNVPNGPRSGKQGCNTGIAVDKDSLWLGLQSGPDQQPHDIVRVAKTNPSLVLSSFAFSNTDTPGPEGLAVDLVTVPGRASLWSNEFGPFNTLRLWDIELTSTGVTPFLGFPLPNRTSSAAIVSVMDHNMDVDRFYKTNDIVTTFTGETGKSSCGVNPDDKGSSQLGYGKVDALGSCLPAGATFVVNGDYLGFGSGGAHFLEYDGHTGYDYRTVDQASSGKIAVFVAASGAVVTTTQGLRSLGELRGANCSATSSTSQDPFGTDLEAWGAVLVFLDPPYDDYLTCYLHLEPSSITTYIGNKQKVAKGDRVGTSDSTAPVSVGAHLHFEVRKKIALKGEPRYVPVDPYGWQGASADDPYYSVNKQNYDEFPLHLNIGLWEDCTDPFKPNNSFNTAFGPLVPSQSYSGKICSPTDQSFFKIAVTGPGSILLSLDVPNTCLNDYNLELYDPAQNKISFSSNGPTQRETMSFTATVVGTYYIRVFGVPLGQSATTCDPAVVLPSQNLATFNTSAPYTLSGTWPSGSVLAVSLIASPSSGPSPLSTALTATASNTATGTFNYTFWWDCNDPGTNVSAVMVACGGITAPALGTCTANANGMKCDAVSNSSQQVTHTYSASGKYTAKVIAENGSFSAESRITVTVGTVPIPAATLSSNSLFFSSQPIGTTSSVQTVTLANVGSAALIITSVELSGSDAGEFTLSPGTTCANGGVVPPGNTCSLNVTFTPSTSGNKSAVVNVADNAAGSPHMVNLSGIATNFTVAPAAGSSTSVTVTAGQTANYSLSVSGTTGFTGTVTFTCSGAPPASTCSVSPISVTLSGTTPTTVTVSVATTRRALLLPRLHLRTPWVLSPPEWILWILLMCVLCAARSYRRFARCRAWLAVAMLLILSVIGCGGGGGAGAPTLQQGTPAGTSTLQVNAISGGATRTISLTLIVN